MPIETIEFNGRKYLKHESEGFAAEHIFSIAKKICKGNGYDVGCNRIEWALPEAIPIDPNLPHCEHDALNLPPLQVDYIFSSHMLEHVPDWVAVLDYWHTKLKKSGICFLYLPHPDQEYWLPFNNRKHIHSFSPELIEKYFMARGWTNIFVNKGYDTNHSFSAIAEKM